MPQVTENFNFYLEDSGETKFKDWRDKINGPNDSNTVKMDNALHGLDISKQDTLAGLPGQVVGFDADGKAVAQDAPGLADAVTVSGGAAIEMEQTLGPGPYTIEIDDDGESAVSAAQVAYDGTQSKINAENVQGAIDALGIGMRRVINLNLLDNSYFADPINQRGQTEYTAAGYTIDRWQSDGGVTVENGFITLPPSKAMFQKFENQKIFFGSTVTISALTADGQLTTSTGALPQTRPSVNTNYILTNTNGIMVYMRISAENQQGGPYVSFYLGNARSTTVNILAAKVEFGPVQTLAHQDEDGNWVLNDPPPNRALELAKCQRYYCKFAVYNSSGYLSDSATIYYIPVTLPVPMRIAPTVSASRFVIRTASGYSKYSGSGGTAPTNLYIRTYSSSNCQLMINDKLTAAAGDTNNTPMTYQIIDLELNADL